MIAVTGNTYPVRDRLRALGCRWDAHQKCWMAPDDRYDEAMALLFPVSGGHGIQGARRDPQCTRSNSVSAAGLTASAGG